MHTDAAIDDREWITRFSARLHARWPTLSREQRDDAAAELASQSRWREMQPEEAVVTWLLPLIPDEDVPF